MTTAISKSSVPDSWSGAAHPRVLIGGAGAPNYGDELIVKGWIDHLAETQPRNESFVFQENIAKQCTKLHLPEWHPQKARVFFRDSAAKAAKLIPKQAIWAHTEFGYNFLRDFGFAKSGYAGFAEMFDTPTIHLHGGGYLSDGSPHKAFYLGLAAAFAKTYQTRIFATGIGFGPVVKPCRDPGLFQEIMDCFEFFEVRDQISLETLHHVAPDARVIHGTDDCFIVPAEKVFRRDSSLRRLHLSFSHGYMEKYPDAFWPWLAQEAEGFEEVVFWESYPWFDKVVIEKLRSHIPRVKVHSTYSLLFEPPPIGDLDVFVSHRFHVHYAAARAGARGFYHAPSPYYVQKHESITKAGSGLLPLDMKCLPSLKNLPAVRPLDDARLRGEKLQIARRAYLAPAGAPISAS